MLADKPDGGCFGVSGRRCAGVCEGDVIWVEAFFRRHAYRVKQHFEILFTLAGKAFEFFQKPTIKALHAPRKDHSAEEGSRTVRWQPF